MRQEVNFPAPSRRLRLNVCPPTRARLRAWMLKTIWACRYNGESIAFAVAYILEHSRCPLGRETVESLAASIYGQ